jgi:hypothetical protein
MSLCLQGKVCVRTSLGEQLKRLLQFRIPCCNSVDRRNLWRLRGDGATLRDLGVGGQAKLEPTIVGVE